MTHARVSLIDREAWGSKVLCGKRSKKVKSTLIVDEVDCPRCRSWLLGWDVERCERARREPLHL